MLAIGVTTDRKLAGALADLVNRVYETAERGLWRNGAARTTPAEMGELIDAGEIVVATRDGELVGSVRLHDVGDDGSEFGMLVAAPDQRSTGVGRALLDFAEQHSRERGRRTMQLELLLPRGWSHPNKEFLKDWYGRRGYRTVHVGRLDDDYPHLAPLLAVDCDLEIRRKAL